MKQQKITTAILFALLILLVAIGCKKEPAVSQQIPGFSWQLKGKSYTSNFDTVFSSPGNVRAYIMIGGTGFSLNNYFMGPRFDMDSISVGSYKIGNVNLSDGNVIMNCIDETGVTCDALSGTVNITSNTANHISGNFSATLFDGTANQQITGTFSNVPVGN